MADKTEDDLEHVGLGRLGTALGFRFRRVQNKLARDFATNTAAWKLRSGMFSSLEIIATNPGISQAMLSTEVGLDKSAVVPLVDDLERRGWVIRTRSLEDRRRNHLSITEAGKTELDSLARLMVETESKALAVLTDAEREMISDALDKVYNAHIRTSRNG
ncbi:MarR family transcriptional regulator [Sphingomonas sp. AOB5]|uniref:MarR family winged helix-turn-helix transcriptional regulator n=1 Tax=Sphingomonas sp. AOB5 TaxID=3034017 RepID=UPI0023F8D520|nr:MarR family transcriptional regulator [Sphingomonas sp. AOB5]MDF7776351.1 MarR family transcriptional regulator [Sphingomonas sp. AOB5]